MYLPERVLFVGAHCDDIELFAGATLARVAGAGAEIGVIVFSDHRGVVNDVEAARARAEWEANVAALRNDLGARVTDHSGAMMPACHGAFESQRGDIYAALERIRDQYDLVVTHAPGDSNQDHQQVANECVRVFKQTATVLGGEFPANDCGRFTAQVYVAVDESDVEWKVRLVGRYDSQRRSHRGYLDATLQRALARVRGSQIGEPAAEAFEVLSRVVIRRRA